MENKRKITRTVCQYEEEGQVVARCEAVVPRDARLMMEVMLDYDYKCVSINYYIVSLL
jgi:hypothetical protein